MYSTFMGSPHFLINGPLLNLLPLSLHLNSSSIVEQKNQSGKRRTSKNIGRFKGALKNWILKINEQNPKRDEKSVLAQEI